LTFFVAGNPGSSGEWKELRFPSALSISSYVSYGTGNPGRLSLLPAILAHQEKQKELRFLSAPRTFFDVTCHIGNPVDIYDNSTPPGETGGTIVSRPSVYLVFLAIPVVLVSQQWQLT
jgi:hypothetical protein